MPFSKRPRESDSSPSGGRRTFRSLPDFNRFSRDGSGNGPGSVRDKNARPAPPEFTGAENFYYVKQMNSRTPMVIIMTDGEEIRGCIEWYDRTCLKVNRTGAPNLLIQKHCIKYVFKQEELNEST